VMHLRLCIPHLCIHTDASPLTSLCESHSQPEIVDLMEK
jgi:hypothetical protein